MGFHWCRFGGLGLGIGFDSLMLNRVVVVDRWEGSNRELPWMIEERERERDRVRVLKKKRWKKKKKEENCSDAKEIEEQYVERDMYVLL